jgi:hypothetical protein
MMEKLYRLVDGLGLPFPADKVLHFGVMLLVLSFGVPLAIWLSGTDAVMLFRYALWVLFDVGTSDREFAQLTMLILSQIAIFYKEHRDGWVKGWFFDVFAGELGVLFGLVIGGGIIARLLGM